MFKISEVAPVAVPTEGLAITPAKRGAVTTVAYNSYSPPWFMDLIESGKQIRLSDDVDENHPKKLCKSTIYWMWKLDLVTIAEKTTWAARRTWPRSAETV